MPSYEWTQVSFWKHPHLSYPVFMAFSILGGIIGLDHLYLRSPMTALIKALSFFALPFFWYLYDILQAGAEKEKFMKYGLTTPIITTAGIGAGMFKKEDDDSSPPENEVPPSPLFFLGYVLLGIIPIGLDLFLIGDNKGGLFKLLIALIPLLGWLYVAVWTAANYFGILFNTEKIFTEGVTHFKTPFLDPTYYSDRIGSPAGKSEEPKKMSFTDLLKAIWEDIKEYFLGGDKKKKDGEETHGFFSAIFSRIKDYLQKNVIDKSPALQKAVSVGQTVKEKVGDTAIQVASTAIETGSELAEVAAGLPGDAADAVYIMRKAANDKFKALGPPQGLTKTKMEFPPVQSRLQQGGGGLIEDSSATIALIGMLVIVASLSLGKYIFVKFHTKAEKKADAEVPPTRSEFVAVRSSLSDEPPQVEAKV